MPDDLVRIERLLAQFDGVGSACVAFSGGVDSSVVLAAAARALGPARVTAFTAVSPTYLEAELAVARAVAAGLGVEHVVAATREFDDPRFVANSRDRCYYCKAGLLDEMGRVAGERGRDALFDGANADDAGDHRPGLRAAAERGVRQPLRAAGIGKDEVRRLARDFGLPTAEAPQQACLASRVPYGEPITTEKLAAVAAAEAALHELGFRQCRVRHHGQVARLEIEAGDLERAVEWRDELSRRVRAAGFTYVALDLDGFRSGSMNEARDTVPRARAVGTRAGDIDTRR